MTGRAVTGRPVLRRLVLTGALSLVVGAGVVVGWSPDDTAPSALPDTSTAFSIDMEVSATLDHATVYAVEQRARPAYRIFALDPATGKDRTVFTVPEDAIVYSIALSPDGASLAVAYSPDFQLSGNGIALLDLATGDLTEVSATVPGVHLTDPVWAEDGEEVLATRVDRRSDDEVLDVVSVAMADGGVSAVVPDAVGPALVDGTVYFLRVGDDLARREVGRLEETGEVTTLQVADGEQDLDHLVGQEGELSVAVLEEQDGQGLTLGSAAQAHGSHVVPSVRWSVPLIGGSAPQVEDGGSLVVHDAAADGAGGVVTADREGLSITVDGTRHALVESRAIRFVTA